MKIFCSSSLVGSVLGRLYGRPKNLRVFVNSTETLVKAEFQLAGQGDEVFTQIFSVDFLQKEFYRIRKAKGIALANARGRIWWDATTKMAIVWGESGASYRLAVRPSEIRCECRDWENQAEKLQGRACCKHVFGILHLLGIGSLNDFAALGTEIVQALEARPSGPVEGAIYYPEEVFRPTLTPSELLGRDIAPRIPQVAVRVRS